jgi:hypothetical protein
VTEDPETQPAPDDDWQDPEPAPEPPEDQQTHNEGGDGDGTEAD